MTAEIVYDKNTNGGKVGYLFLASPPLSTTMLQYKVTQPTNMSFNYIYILKNSYIL